MLVLSRKVGSRMVVAGNVEIEVVKISGNRVRLGITAPCHVAINRLELCSRIDHPGSEIVEPTTSPEVQDGCQNFSPPAIDTKDRL